MMTMEQQDRLFNSLPKNLYDQYRFRKSFDYSGWESIPVMNGLYYPELNRVVIADSISIEWETGMTDVCEVDVQNPEHMKELRHRAIQRMDSRMVGIIRPGRKNPMACMVQWSNPGPGYQSILVDGTHIYYRPEEFDLEHDEDLRTLAACLFVARRYETIQVVPYKDTHPEEWGGDCI